MSNADSGDGTFQAIWQACAWTVALALLLLVAPTPTPAQVAGDAAGPRSRIDASGYPWRIFGRLNRQGSGFCTAVLVGPDLVLTAAHCLYVPRTGRLAAPNRVHFVAGYQNQGYAFHAQAKRYHVAAGYAPSGATATPAEEARDWAMVELTTAAPASLGYLGIARLDHETALPSPASFVLAGYGRDRPYALSSDGDCRLVAWEANSPLVLHDCRAAHGTSGAPIVRKRNGDWLVYALHVGRAEVQGHDEKLGVAVPAHLFFEALRAATKRPVERTPDGLDILPGRAGK
jgi:protease YdgD